MTLLGTISPQRKHVKQRKKQRNHHGRCSWAKTFSWGCTVGHLNSVECLRGKGNDFSIESAARRRDRQKAVESRLPKSPSSHPVLRLNAKDSGANTGALYIGDCGLYGFVE